MIHAQVSVQGSRGLLRSSADSLSPASMEEKSIERKEKKRDSRPTSYY
jgi:hypothetical protein